MIDLPAEPEGPEEPAGPASPEEPEEPEEPQYPAGPKPGNAIMFSFYFTVTHCQVKVDWIHLISLHFPYDWKKVGVIK